MSILSLKPRARLVLVINAMLTRLQLRYFITITCFQKLRNMYIIQTTSIKLTFTKLIYLKIILKTSNENVYKVFHALKGSLSKIRVLYGHSSFLLYLDTLRIVSGDIIRSYKRLNLMYPRESYKRRPRYYLACKHDLQTVSASCHFL